MQYKKLTKKQKIIRWNRQRWAAKIGRLMADNPNMTLLEARQELNRQKREKHEQTRQDD
jgi:hypothetical protein